MENPIYISLSRMMALRNQMDVVANNVANANSTAYKQQRVLFSEFLKKPAMGEQISMVRDRATVRDMSQGPLTATNNPLDLAINGKGFFVVDTLNGPRYTRNGRFQLDGKGGVVDVNGLPVLDAKSKPVTIPAGASRVRVTSDGSVLTDLDPTNAVAKIAMVSFEKEHQLVQVGAGLFTTASPDQQPIPASKDIKVTQGMIEESNVKPILEMTNMIGVLRQYQGMQKIIDAEHERQKAMIQKLGRSV